MPHRIPRRRFLQTSAVLAASGALAPHVLGAQDPKERIRIGVVGVTGQGGFNIGGVREEDIIALCDVDAERAAPVRKQFPRARFYEDYRDMIAQKDIQAVVVCTPDHHHAFATLAALRAGKHVYCEKPLTHSVQECRLVMETAAKSKLATQMGTQIHAENNYRRVVEIVQAGVLGPIRRVHVWCSRRPDPMFRAQAAAAPRTLNYDLWLGPAPARDYPPYRFAGRGIHFDWRWLWEYGGGVLADMACHFMDLPHWALNLRSPTTIAAQGEIAHKGDANADMPALLQVDYQYPARGDLPAVHLTWYHGQPGPDLTGKTRYEGFPSGVLFEGEKGNLVSDYSHHRLLPEDRFRNFVAPKPTIAASIGHHREWLQAIRMGTPTTCNFAYSGALTEAVLLGNVAFRAGGGKLEYDAKTGRITNNEKAERWLRREYRKGWTL